MGNKIHGTENEYLNTYASDNFPLKFFFSTDPLILKIGNHHTVAERKLRTEGSKQIGEK